MNRQRLCQFALALLAFAALAPSPAAAGDFGLRGGVYTDQSDPFVGFEYLTPMGPSHKWFFNPNLEFVFGDRGDTIAGSFDVHYDFDVEAAVYVWAGFGATILHFDPDRANRESDTEAGLNLLAGVGFNKGRPVRPYIQGKVVLADESEFALAFGVRF